MRDVTIAQLPTGIREQFGFVLSRKVYRRNAVVIRVVQWATKILPVWIRHLPMRLMLRHIDQLAQD